MDYSDIATGAVLRRCRAADQKELVHLLGEVDATHYDCPARLQVIHLKSGKLLKSGVLADPVLPVLKHLDQLVPEVKRFLQLRPDSSLTNY